MPRERFRDRDECLYHKVDAYRLVENLEHCLQCGKCAGICPVANLSPSYNPRQIINDVLSGSHVRWLNSEEIWRCFWCAGCYTLCPVDIHFPLLMMQLRYLAVASRHGLKYIVPFKRFALRAREEYRALFDLTGTTDFLEQIREEEDMPVELTYLEGRITRE